MSKRAGVSVKTMKKMLKKAGLKVSGKKAALTRRCKKAHLKVMGGGPHNYKDMCEKAGGVWDPERGCLKK